MRKSFNTSIEEDVQNEFKAFCARQGVPMNTMLETLMKACYEKKVEIVIKQNTSIEIEKK